MGLRHTTGRCGLAARFRPRIAAATLVAGAALLAATEPGCTAGGSGPQAPVPPRANVPGRPDDPPHGRHPLASLPVRLADSAGRLANSGSDARTRSRTSAASPASLTCSAASARARIACCTSTPATSSRARRSSTSSTGEPEVRAASMLGTDAMVIGNHEFDDGAINVARQITKWADFPRPFGQLHLPVGRHPARTRGLDTLLNPFTVFNLEGLKVGVIGMANFSSLGSVFDQPNTLGITPLNTIETAQFYVDLLRPYGRRRRRAQPPRSRRRPDDGARHDRHRLRPGRAQSHRHQPAAGAARLLGRPHAPRLRVGGQPEHPVRPVEPGLRSPRHVLPRHLHRVPDRPGLVPPAPQRVSSARARRGT